MNQSTDTVVVTGAARGIGAAIARTFGAAGHQVAMLDIREDEVHASCDVLTGLGYKARAYVADIADPSGIGKAIEAVNANFGRITTLINNAGIAVFSNPQDLSLEDWRRCMSIDLDGAWFVTQACLPDLLALPGGAIVNVASVHSHQIIRGCFPYPVAKHGLLGLTRSLAIEYADQGLRVNAVCPGYIDTPINDEQFALTKDPDRARAKAHALHPPGRMGTAEEVASVVRFLTTQGAAFVNGASIMVDGGRSLVYHD